MIQRLCKKGEGVIPDFLLQDGEAKPLATVGANFIFVIGIHKRQVSHSPRISEPWFDIKGFAGGLHVHTTGEAGYQVKAYA